MYASAVGFKIDEAKFKSAMPPPESSAKDDLKWSFGVFGLVAGVIVWFGLVVWLLLRALA